MRLTALTMASIFSLALASGGALAQSSASDAPPAKPSATGTSSAAPTEGAAPAAASSDAAPDTATAAADAPTAAPAEPAANAESSSAAAPTDAAPSAESAVDAPRTTGAPDTTAVKFVDGRWENAEGIPTFKIEDGKVDYSTYAGYIRYNSMCHVCHGPDGEGSTFAPAIKNSVANKLDYYQFMQIVASGLQDVSSSQTLVMPAFGTDRNVWCYVNDIYVYLLARGTDALPRGRPAAHEPKSDEFREIENSCMS